MDAKKNHEKTSEDRKFCDNKLFVGGLSWDTTEAMLSRVFGDYGKVAEVKVLLDRETGRSRGFGFVTFTYASDAMKALAMDGQEIDGRRLRVSIAENKPKEGPARPEGRSSRPQGDQRPPAQPSTSSGRPVSASSAPAQAAPRPEENAGSTTRRREPTPDRAFVDRSGIRPAPLPRETPKDPPRRTPRRAFNDD